MAAAGGLSPAWVETELALAVASTCSAVACVISLYTIVMHMRHYTVPRTQLFTIRILFIVPMYAICSAVALKLGRSGVFADVVRDVYEAFVVYSFLNLVLEYAGGEGDCVARIQQKPPLRHIWPFSYCTEPMRRDGQFLRYCKRGTIQFVIVKPVLALLSLIVLVAGKYFTPGYQTFLMVVYNISYTWALYCLFLFYMSTREILAPYRPVLKFLAVKSIVFMTYWQSLIVGAVPMEEEEALRWNDFILCVEMVGFAVMLALAFSYRDFIFGIPDSAILTSVREVMSVKDIVQDAIHNFKPAYQDYVLQRGADEAPEKIRTKTYLVGNLDTGVFTGGDEGTTDEPRRAKRRERRRGRRKSGTTAASATMGGPGSAGSHDKNRMMAMMIPSELDPTRQASHAAAKGSVADVELGQAALAGGHRGRGGGGRRIRRHPTRNGASAQQQQQHYNDDGDYDDDHDFTEDDDGGEEEDADSEFDLGREVEEIEAGERASEVALQFMKGRYHSSSTSTHRPDSLLASSKTSEMWSKLRNKRGSPPGDPIPPADNRSGGDGGGGLGSFLTRGAFRGGTNSSSSGNSHAARPHTDSPDDDMDISVSRWRRKKVEQSGIPGDRGGSGFANRLAFATQPHSRLPEKSSSAASRVQHMRSDSPSPPKTEDIAVTGPAGRDAAASRGGPNHSKLLQRTNAPYGVAAVPIAGPPSARDRSRGTSRAVCSVPGNGRGGGGASSGASDGVVPLAGQSLALSATVATPQDFVGEDVDPELWADPEWLELWNDQHDRAEDGAAPATGSSAVVPAMPASSGDSAPAWTASFSEGQEAAAMAARAAGAASGSPKKTNPAPSSAAAIVGGHGAPAVKDATAHTHISGPEPLPGIGRVHVIESDEDSHDGDGEFADLSDGDFEAEFQSAPVNAGSARGRADDPTAQGNTGRRSDTNSDDDDNDNGSMNLGAKSAGVREDQEDSEEVTIAFDMDGGSPLPGSTGSNAKDDVSRGGEQTAETGGDLTPSNPFSVLRAKRAQMRAERDGGAVVDDSASDAGSDAEFLDSAPPTGGDAANISANATRRIAAMNKLRGFVRGKFRYQRMGRPQTGDTQQASQQQAQQTSARLRGEGTRSFTRTTIESGST